MAQLPAQEAIVRFTENENRLDKFVNEDGTYATNTTPSQQIKTLPSFIEEMTSRYLTYSVKGEWATGTTYEVQDIFTKDNIAYLVIQNHTSGVFANDLTSGKFAIYQGATKQELGTPGGSNLVILIDGRSVQKFAENFHTLDRYGAKGNGADDDSNAIEEALNYAPDVNLLRGVAGKSYRVTRTIEIVGNKTFGGESGGSHGFQPMYIFHDPASVGELFNVTQASSGVALLNFTVTGGNGSPGIVSSNSDVRYEFIRFAEYNGGAIKLLSSGVGSSSSLIRRVHWTGPNYATSLTGLEIDCAGGDVAVEHFTALRGAIGINVIQGQTITMDRVSLNKQTRYPGSQYSNASQFNTAAIKLSGAGYKEAISISRAYIEACDNGVYAEACEALTIEKSLFYDSGAAGVIGAWEAFGNSAINLTSANVKNTTIQANHITALSNGNASNFFYALRLNDSQNSQLLNNFVKTTGTYNSPLMIGANGSAFELGNTWAQSGSMTQPRLDPNKKIINLGATPQNTSYSATLENSWVAESGSNNPNFRIDAMGFVSLSGIAKNGTVGTSLFTLPVEFRPVQQESFLVNSNGAVGVISVFTNGQVVLNSGNNTYVYLSGIKFKAA